MRLKKYIKDRKEESIIIQNCSTKVAEGKIKNYDIMVWITSILQYKKLGYRIKLYCSSKDIPNLKKYHIYDLYDEVDTKVYDNEKQTKNVDLNIFWSAKKIVALNDAFKKHPNCIYSDTDIVPFNRYDTSKSYIFWCKEPDSIYDIPSWYEMSTPKGYRYKKFIVDQLGAFNFGVVKWGDYKLFKKYYKEYFKFVRNNPATIPDSVTENITSFYACAAEQRLAKAILDYNKINPYFLSEWEDKGLCQYGFHIFIYKKVWDLIDKESKNLNQNLKSEAINQYFSLRTFCIDKIKNYCKDIGNDELINYVLSIIKEKENTLIYK